VRTLLARVRDAGVFIVPGAAVIDALSPAQLVVDFGGRVDVLDAGAVIVATGARERFLPFPGWTLPGVSGVGGVQALMKGGMDVHGRRVILAGTGPLLFPVAAALAGAGARLLLVAEQAPAGRVARFAARALRSTSRLADAVRYRAAFARTPYRTSSWVVRASGAGEVQRVVVRIGASTREFECDLLGCAAGLVPVTDVARLLGCTVDGGGVVVDEQQRTSVPGVWAAGECTGVKGDAPADVEGTIAGLDAAGDRDGALAESRQAERDQGRAFGALLADAFALRDEVLALAESDTIICRCEDVVRGAIDGAWTQRQAKLWTRVGMGACQGAVCGPLCTAMFGWTENAVRAPLGAPRCGDWSDVLTSR
jgi:NADPH-dependent 2,4-dienoyl-CoA reductase/sulfur reductase-like enzyme